MEHKNRRSISGLWSSSWAFILAATGAAVGLGNIWKFPYITGKNGGGAFVLVYLICIAAIGIPLLMAEILIGRRGRRNPAMSMRLVSQEEGHSTRWRVVGAMAIIASVLILSYYSVIAGWSLAYIAKAIAGEFAHISGAQSEHLFADFSANAGQLLFWHTLSMVMTIWVVYNGVQKGIERAVTLMFPCMLVILLILVGYAMEAGNFAQAVDFLFKPDFSKLTTSGTLSALGHAFFTLSLATGSIMIYGAYVPKHVSIGKAAFAIAIADTGIALLAGLAIFPIVFKHGLPASAGPGLLFQSLPIAFGDMTYGNIFAALFFIMLFFAAYTSAISLLEPSVAWIVETFKIPRHKAAVISGIVIWVLGIGTILSFSTWSSFTLFGKTFFESLDYLTSNIMLPIGGLFTALFAGWFISKQTALDEFEVKETWAFKLWYYTIRYVTPIAILIVALQIIGIINFG